MNTRKKSPKIKVLQAGFTAFELIGVLVVLTFLIMTTNKIMNNIHKSREFNQLADQSKSFSQVAAKYIEDNYRNLVKDTVNNNIILSYEMISSHMSTNMSAFTRRGEYPCIYITSDSNTQQMSSLRAYMILGNKKISGKTFTGGKLSKLDKQNIAHIIGMNAGILVRENDIYKFEGGINNNLQFPNLTINAITSSCGFISPLPSDSLIIDLSKSTALFSSLKGTIDRQSTDTEDDPSLKKSGSSLTTMQTNLYLDNIYQEESRNTKYDCPNIQQIKDDANSFCINSQPGLQISPYTARWVSVIQKGQSCEISAVANFYQDVIQPTCKDIDMGSPNSYCDSTIADKNMVPNSAMMSTVRREGNQCVADVSANYTSMPSCIYKGDSNAASIPPDYNDRLRSLCSQAGPGWVPCGPDNGRGNINYPDFHGTYVSARGECQIQALQCANAMLCRSNTGLVSGYAKPAVGDTGGGTSRLSCRQAIKSLPVYSPIDKGTHACGSKIIDAIDNSTTTPAKHIYKAIDFGQSGVSTNQRIQLRSNAAVGDATTASQLNVTGAGLEAGYFAPTSHDITPGSICDSASVGKIAQDLSGGGNLMASQLQCMYNPTFCSDAGYCYLPVKNSSFIYTYTPLVQKGMCPPGTVVDNSQPSDGIDTKDSNGNEIKNICTTLGNGWITPNKPIGLTTDGYKSNITGLTFYQGYQTVCRYRQSGNSNIVEDIRINVLRKLQCTNTTTTYTVDNYQQ